MQCSWNSQQKALTKKRKTKNKKKRYREQNVAHSSRRHPTKFPQGS